jgi:hypothetical protein
MYPLARRGSRSQGRLKHCAVFQQPLWRSRHFVGNGDGGETPPDVPHLGPADVVAVLDPCDASGGGLRGFWDGGHPTRGPLPGFTNTDASVKVADSLTEEYA